MGSGWESQWHLYIFGGLLNRALKLHVDIRVTEMERLHSQLPKNAMKYIQRVNRIHAYRAVLLLCQQ